MLKYIVNGNMWATAAEYIVIPVNTVGVPGAGLARQWARYEPDLVPRYKALCQRNDLEPGGIVTLNGHIYAYRKYILFATKEHWSKPSKIEWIDKGLDALNQFMLENFFPSVALPLIGCGFGGLDRTEVTQHIQGILTDPSINATVYV